MAVTYRTQKGPGGVSVFATSDQWEEHQITGQAGYPTGFVGVARSHERPNFAQYDDRWTPPSERGLVSLDHHLEMGGTGEPTELFTHYPPKVGVAFVDPKLRHHVPTMVGIAMHAMGDQHDKVMADESLTQFSSRLARNAVDKGLAVPHPHNPNMEASSDTPRAPRMARRLDNVSVPPGDPVSRRQVTQAKEWVRSRLRPDTPLPHAAQGQQLQGQMQLPGLEDK